MGRRARIAVKDRNPVASLRDFLKTVLEKGGIDAMQVPHRLPMERSVMPVLIADPEKMEGADPLAPSFPLNAARMLSRLTRKQTDAVIAAVMRPCEIRAFVELVKLKQGSTENVILIGLDCLGAFSNADYTLFAESSPDGESTLGFYRNVLAGNGLVVPADISPACKSCEHPVPVSADLTIGLFGADISESLLLLSNTEKGDRLLDALGLPEADEPAGRRAAIETLTSQRAAYRDKMFEETSEATADLDKLMAYLANCVNCHNCRVACPVCYCRECVFTTDVFDHEPSQYLRWARRKGILKMPADTVFFHLTRLAHMSTACIGCGQCSNACPNGIPVMELFRTIANGTQRAFGSRRG